MTPSENFLEKAGELAMTYGPKIFLALAVLFIGSRIVRRICKTVDKVLVRKDFDVTLRPFIIALLSWTLKILLFISVAQMLGVETTSFVAVLGASSLAIGLALQGSLSNFAGGVIILVLRPFNVGDYISAQGEEGVVQKIDIFSTVLLCADNKRVILPNGPLAGGNITNVTGEPRRRIDLTVGIGYSDDVGEALRILHKMCVDQEMVLDDPKPFVGVFSYGDSAINLVVRPWVLTENYWPVYFDLNKKTKEVLDASGISIPFPQRDVHLFQETPPSA